MSNLSVPMKYAVLACGLVSSSWVQASDFWLIDAATDRKVVNITPGMVICSESQCPPQFSFSDEPSTPVLRTVIKLTGKINRQRTEFQAPYALFGNKGSDYFAQPSNLKLVAGDYTLTSGSKTVSFSVGLSSPTTQPQPTPVSRAYPLNSGPSKNPHKGWNSGWFNTFEEASVGFQYIPWNAFEPKDNEFDFDAVEKIIDRVGSTHKHLILRLYCDWGPTNATACPGWLYDQKGVERLQGADGTYITDYNNPTYVSQAVEAIRALAGRYDNDPRLYAFQIGLLGYWGEWHTYGFKFPNGNGYSISDDATNTVIEAYKTSFKRVQIQGRYPWREPLKSTGGIGFHNDYFVVNHNHGAEFDTAIDTWGQWLHGPIGGETPPRSDTQWAAEIEEMYAATSTPKKGQAMIAKGRYSTMAGGYRVPPGHPHYESSMQLHRMMGYNFQINKATFADVLPKESVLSVDLDVTNIGVAPFYYNWSVQFALLNSDNEVKRLSPASFSLKTAKPQDVFKLSAQMAPSADVGAGEYRLAVRIIQPGADQPKANTWKLDARHTYILFANELPIVDGSWGVNHALIGGWSVLGPITLK